MGSNIRMPVRLMMSIRLKEVATRAPKCEFRLYTYITHYLVYMRVGGETVDEWCGVIVYRNTCLQTAV